MAALDKLFIWRKPTCPVYLSKKDALLSWTWESPTNQTLQLVDVNSLTHFELPLTQLSRPLFLSIHWHFPVT